MGKVPAKKILIVEDSRLQAQIAANMLGKYGYITEIAVTAEETLHQARSPECPDLILMDIDLGEGLDGTTLTKQIQQIKDIPVVFFTAISTQEAVEKLRAVTRYGYVLKGAPEHVLVSTVEMALKLHEALSLAQMYRRIVEDALTEIYIFHPDTFHLLAANRGASKNLGYTVEDLRRMSVPNLVPELNMDDLRELLLPLQQGKQEKIAIEIMHRRKDGSLYPAEAHLQFFGRGKDRIGVAFVLDLTERKKMEEKLRQKGEFLRSLLAALPVGIFIIDPASHRIEEANLEALYMIGASLDEVIGRPCWEFFKPAGECPIPASDKEISRSERSLVRKDGMEILVLKTVKRLRTSSGEKLLEAFIDISERKYLEEELYRLSITDPLTGAYNRRYFLEMLERELERCRRTGHPLALIMFDLDHFKSINDRFGHTAGDQVLKSLVAAFKERLRKTDCLARWGGEEFIVLLPDTPAEGAAGLAHELRTWLNRMKIQDVGHVTASFGVTGYRPEDVVDSIIQRVDGMLYRAKGNGRNCVCA